MSLSCAIPPLDMRYSRVVARNAQGMDLMAFGADRRPAGAQVVAPLGGTVHRLGELTRYEYRNAVVIEVAAQRYVCLSGLAFSGRAEAGAVVGPGTVIGSLEVPGRMDFLRSRDRTSGASPNHPYLHVEVWSRLPPVFDSHLGASGIRYSLVSGSIAPGEFWPSVGLDFSGTRGSEMLLVRAGSNADCRGAS